MPPSDGRLPRARRCSATGSECPAAATRRPGVLLPGFPFRGCPPQRGYGISAEDLQDHVFQLEREQHHSDDSECPGKCQIAGPSSEEGMLDAGWRSHKPDAGSQRRVGIRWVSTGRNCWAGLRSRGQLAWCRVGTSQASVLARVAPLAEGDTSQSTAALRRH